MPYDYFTFVFQVCKHSVPNPWTGKNFQLFSRQDGQDRSIFTGNTQFTDRDKKAHFPAFQVLTMRMGGIRIFSVLIIINRFSVHLTRKIKYGSVEALIVHQLKIYPENDDNPLNLLEKTVNNTFDKPV